MPESLPYIVLALAALGLWGVGLERLGVFLPDDVRAWRRLATLRGHALPQTRIERAVRTSRSLQRLQAELDLERLLGRAGRAETPLAFIGKAVAVALLVFAGCLVLDALGRAASGAWPAPPWAALVVAAAMLPLAVLDLRRASRRTSEAAELALGDMLMLVAVITDTRGLQLHDAVRMLARCARNPSLAALLDREGYKRLAAGPHRSTVDLYRAIAHAYGLEAFAELADVAMTTNVGVPEREAFARLALAQYERRLTDARMRTSRAKILVTLPVAAMLIPLLLLIAAPTFQAISGGLGGG